MTQGGMNWIGDIMTLLHSWHLERLRRGMGPSYTSWHHYGIISGHKNIIKAKKEFIVYTANFGRLDICSWCLYFCTNQSDNRQHANFSSGCHSLTVNWTLLLWSARAAATNILIFTVLMTPCNCYYYSALWKIRRTLYRHVLYHRPFWVFLMRPYISINNWGMGFQMSRSLSTRYKSPP